MLPYPIGDQLTHLKEEGRIPFHMPGHKRKEISFFKDVMSKDITEITGYDNLHHPEGMIAESMDLLKRIYHSKKSWYLVNGSTVGILAAISATCNPGDYIMIARNCHKAVYNAVRLLHLHPVYLYPSYSEEFDMMQGIVEEDVVVIDEMIQRYEKEGKKIKALLITSPTYEGVVSNVAALKEMTKNYGIPLIVDEAHGAHLVFHEAFPKSAVDCGADLVIQSSHKTLPAFTQTALLHLCSDQISQEKVEEMLSIYQTSSPSYLLMASAEYGVIYSQNHPDKMAEYVDNLMDFRKKCAQLKHISLLEKGDVKGFDYDIGKLVFISRVNGFSGKNLFDQMLNDFSIEFEMETAGYCIAMTSIMDEKDDYDALWHALESVDHDLDQRMSSQFQEEASEELQEMIQEQKLFDGKPEKAMEAWEALDMEGEEVDWLLCDGRIAKDYLYLYPPGIPLLVPGEKITKEMLVKLNYYLYNGYNVPSLSEGKLRVLKESKK
ncbi:MAG: aminotransferase class I/II-fold pyridoxal phosphate-dependent enzyme [Eubacteriales bacterium]|nr:aminotransferase class I/II-fold pyridoxal phosphate-dependent enzyme [Eubacteriales bacterium]